MTDLFIVLSRQPINNVGAYLVQSRCKSLGIDRLYTSEYEDSTEQAQYIAVGPITSGDAGTIYSLIAAAGGDPIKLKEV